MPIIIRLADRRALPRELLRLIQAGEGTWQIECWGEEEFCCPYCGEATPLRRPLLSEAYTCSSCKRPFWARDLPWSALITSTDDPALRHHD